MRDTELGTTSFMEMQGHYGISPYSPERSWKPWMRESTLERARATITAFPLDEKPTWRDPNGWRILDVIETAMIDDGTEPEEVAPSKGRFVEMRYEVQGIRHSGGLGSGRWRRWQDPATLAEGRAAISRLAEASPRDGRPDEIRLLLVARDILIVDQPVVENLLRHDLPPEPDPATTSLVHHHKGQPSAHGVTWASDGFHEVRRPQMGPLPLDAHQHRRDDQLVRLA